MRIYFLIIILFYIWNCKSSKQYQPDILQLSDDQKILFLDSVQASTAIVSDTMEHFFDQINTLDMSIQLKQKRIPSVDRNSLLKEYKMDLQEDVMNFTPEEISFIKDIFKTVFSDCNEVSKSIFPAEIKLIKIRGSHYGEGTFYTRENCIIIPQSDLTEPDEQDFTKVMLHEVFHIFSRLNPQQKLDLYELIGFKSTGGKQLLQINETLKEKVLLNPDGINYAYSIQLRDKNETSFHALPLIFSNADDFDENKPEFFDYLQFELFKIIPPFSKMIKVVSDTIGKSTIDFKNHPEFFEQITENSNYIIHPDELMAENFVIAVQSQKDSTILNELSDSGEKLIENMIKILGE